MENSKIRVLAVDDNPDNLISIKALINEAFPDAFVLTALTGQKGFEIAVAEDPDVILLDIVMPEMDGFEVCRKIKADKNLNDTPIVFVTAVKENKENRILALECGAEAFLSKPIDESELTAQIRAMVKIKTARKDKRDEKQRLAFLVEERTRELKAANIKSLELLKTLEKEIEFRKQSESALLESKEYFELMFNTSPDAALITRMSDGTIINANEGFTKMSGYTREEAIGKKSLALKLYQNPADRNKVVKNLLEKGYCNGVEATFRRKDGSTLVGMMSSKVISLKGVSYISSNINDITERKTMEDNLLYMSYHDYLTDLYNRRFFEQEIIRIDVRKMLPLSIVVGDINGVKLINDAFGHSEGDRLIVNAAKIMSSCCLVGDVLARTGGDEFAMLMPKTDGEAAIERLRCIKVACEKYNSTIPNEAFRISVSLGFGTKKTVDQSFDMIMKIADKFMYQRKLLEHKSMHNAILASIKATLLEKNEETEEHCERLIILSKAIGKALNLSQKEIDELELLSSLHDIGKIGIAERILNKPGKLNEEEWLEMKKHPEIGHRIASASPELASIAEYILSHHERWDGTGYPQNLAMEQIPLLSRILAIVDAYDAMTQNRPYRIKMTEDAAIAEIKMNSGTQFDPNVAELFVTKVLDKEWVHPEPPKNDY